MVAMKARPAALPDGPIALTLHYRPTNARVDEDGFIASLKSYLDGIAAALCVNDNRFRLTPVRGEPVKGGLVIVEIGNTGA
jgi:hypothetical protein